MGHEHFKMLPAPREHAAIQRASDARGGEAPATRPGRRAEDEGDGESDFKTRVGVYEAIVRHQRGANWWANCDDLKLLRKWGGFFIRAFDLRVKDTVSMGMPLVRIEPMNVKTIGAYHPEPDGYAIIGSLGFNEERLRTLPVFMKLVLLLKCLLCAWRHQKGGDGDFDRECRGRMKSLGLIVTEKGAITIDADGPFHQLLEAAGIEVPVASVFPRPERTGKTTSRLWSCTCQRCRVGTSTFLAVCTACGEPFRLGDHVGKRFVRSDSLVRL